MGRTITKAVAVGILPFGFSVLAYLTVRELLFWPRL